MRKVTILLTVVGFVLGFVGISAAHQPPGETFFAVQFPDDAVPTIDGDLTDWEIVPTSPYTILTDKLYDSFQLKGLGRGGFDATNINIRHRVGWNENANMLYFAIEVFDNIHNTDRADASKFFHDDAIEIEVNPLMDTVEGLATNLSYKFAVPPFKDTFIFLRPLEPIGYTWMAPGSRWLDFGWSFTGDQFGESTYYYEVAIRPVETMPTDEAASEDGVVEFDLEEGETIHITTNVVDVDEGDDRDVYWSMAGEPSCCQAVNDFVLMEMDPKIETAVETNTWARIKSQFK